MSSTTGIDLTETHAGQSVYDSVKQYYGRTLSSSKDLKTSACTAYAGPHLLIREAIARVPKAVNDKFYGCGSPLPLGIDGLSVLDLGSGSGRDCYVAAVLVGPKGRVQGVDMTEEQLEVARSHIPDFEKQLGRKVNLEFRKGYIEFLKDAGIGNESIDLCISNCVVNLSPNKELVLKGVYDALKPGGEFHFSDVYADRRLPEAIRKHDVLLGECIGGALYTEDFRRICQKVGFLDPRMLNRPVRIPVNSPELAQLLGPAKFYSITYRLFKVPHLEDRCENYDQVAIYLGTIPGSDSFYDLDDHHRLHKDVPFPVCGNTAAMLSSPSWLAPHFNVTGTRDRHYGLFDCSGSKETEVQEETIANACVPGGACC